MNLGQENEFVEFKKTTSEIKEGMVSIAAILNKHGRGELYFGVGNGGEVLGQDVSETTLRQLGQAIATSIKPAIYPTIEALEDGKRGYIRVAFSGFEAPYACKGKYYIRVADTDVQMSQEELSRMFLYARAREVPWDQWESSRPVADVDEAELPPHGEIYALLKDLGAPLSPADIGIPESETPICFKATKDIRDKYILSSLAYDLGCLDQIASAI